MESNKARYSLTAAKSEIPMLPKTEVSHTNFLNQSVSIILPTKDREEGLKAVLDSIPPALEGIDYEIIICQDKPNETTGSILKNYKNITKVIYDSEIFAEGQKFSWAKIINYGFAQAKGDWLVFGSDDIVFYPKSFQNAFRKINNESIGAVSFLHKNTVETYGGFFDNYGYDTLNGDKIYINFGMIKRKAFEKTNKFDEKFKFYWADVDICMQIWNLGLTIIASEDSLVDHVNILDKVKTDNSNKVFLDDTEYFCSKWQDTTLFKGSSPLEKKRFFLKVKDLETIKDSLQSLDSNPKNNKFLIDGVIFYLQRKIFGGISVVWQNYLEKIANSNIKDQFLLLDRENTAPRIPGLRTISGKSYSDVGKESRFEDAKYIDEICRQEGITHFISTYYTYSLSYKNILMLHDFIPEALGHDLSKKAWPSKKEAILNGNYFLCISDNTRKDFAKFYPQKYDKNNVFTIFNGVSDIYRPCSEFEKLSFKRKYGLTKPFYVICGYRSPHKNVGAFLKAVNLIDDANSFEIIFSGGSEEIEKEYLPLLQDLNYRRFNFPTEEMPLLYNCANALIFLSDYEGFGLPIVEAQKSGCPVITCRNSSIPEVAGEAAIYVDGKDIFAIKNALLSINDERIRRIIIEKGMQQAENFSWDKSFTRFREIMREFGLSDNQNQQKGTVANAVNLSFVNKSKDYWDVSDLYEAMFTRIYIDPSLKNKTLDEQIDIWNRSAQSSVDKILQKIPYKSKWKALEIGCGIGRIIKPLREKLAVVDGVDIAPNMIKFAEEYLGTDESRGKVLVNNGYDLADLKDRTYDLVYSMIVFQHIRSASVVKSYFKEINRVLQDDGYLRIQVFDDTKPGRGKFDEEAMFGIDYGLMGNGYKPEEFRSLLDQHGFEIIDFEYDSPWLWATCKKKISAEIIKQDILVSAIVSTYNAEEYIEGCLQDLVEQTLFKSGQLEIVIIDSASPQNERAIAEKFQNKYPNIRYERTPERETLYKAWNRAVKLSQGKYITNANTDDRHRFDALEIMSKYLEANPDCDLVYTNSKISYIANESFSECESKDVLVNSEFDSRETLLHFQFGPAPMWRKNVHDKIGYFNDKYIAVGDYDFNIRFAIAGLKARWLNETLTMFYKNPNSITYSFSNQQKEKQDLLANYRNPKVLLELYKTYRTDLADRTAILDILQDQALRSLSFHVPGSPKKGKDEQYFSLLCAESIKVLESSQIAPEKKLVILVDSNNFSFIYDFIFYLKKLSFVLVLDSKDDKQLQFAYDWADTIFIEWMHKITQLFAQLKKKQRIITRLHSHEAYKKFIKTTNLENIDSAVFVSDIMVDYLESIDIDIRNKTKVQVISPGIDLEKFPFKNRVHGFNMAFVGHLIQTKNIAFLLQILKMLVNKDKRYHLHLFGEFVNDEGIPGEVPKRYFLDQIQKLGLTDNITLYGYLEHDELVLKMADINYLLSTSYRESLGLNILEAMAMGIMPLIHSWPGAESIYPEELLFSYFEEINDKLCLDYNSQKYREFVVQKHNAVLKNAELASLILDQPIAGPVSEEKVNVFDTWSSASFTPETKVEDELAVLLEIEKIRLEDTPVRTKVNKTLQLTEKYSSRNLDFYLDFLKFNPDDLENRLMFNLFDNGSSLNYILAVEFFVTNNRLIEAENLLQYQIEQRVENSYTWLQLGEIAFVKGDIETARKHFNKSFALNPYSISLLNNLAVLHFYLKQPEKAAEYVNLAIEYCPNYPDAINNRNTILNM